MTKRTPAPRIRRQPAAADHPDGAHLFHLLRKAHRTARRLRAALRGHVCSPNRAGYCDECYLLPALAETIRGTCALANNLEVLLPPASLHRAGNTR